MASFDLSARSPSIVQGSDFPNLHAFTELDTENEFNIKIQTASQNAVYQTKSEQVESPKINGERVSLSNDPEVVQRMEAELYALDLGEAENQQGNVSLHKIANLQEAQSVLQSPEKVLFQLEKSSSQSGIGEQLSAKLIIDPKNGFLQKRVAKLLERPGLKFNFDGYEILASKVKIMSSEEFVLFSKWLVHQVRLEIDRRSKKEKSEKTSDNEEGPGVISDQAIQTDVVVIKPSHHTQSSLEDFHQSVDKENQINIKESIKRKHEDKLSANKREKSKKISKKTNSDSLKLQDHKQTDLKKETIDQRIVNK